MKLRSKKEIQDAEKRFSDITWFYRFTYNCLSQKLDPKNHPGCKGAAEIARNNPGIELIQQHELSEMYGKLCALRWVMGEDWDNLAVL